MRTLIKVLNGVLYLIVATVLIAALGSAMLKRPVLLSVIRSYSMYPLLTRGDMVFIDSLKADQPVRVGDIVLFKTDKGMLASQGWIMHRVAGGNELDGYITKGDNNKETDQYSGGSVPIQREWIASRTRTLAGIPMKIPLLGYIPLWAEGFQTSSYLLPVTGLALAGIIAVTELRPQKKRVRSARLDLPLIYFLGGLTLSIVLAASMLAASQNLKLTYEVSETQKGVITGSNVGIMLVGEKAERPLVDLCNKTLVPIIATCTSDDPQISFSHDKLPLTMGQVVQASFTVQATTPGEYKSTMWVGMFYPFLPVSVIYWLAQKSFWLALTVVALIPALPVMFYPMIDARIRRQTTKEIRRSWRRIRQRLPF